MDTSAFLKKSALFLTVLIVAILAFNLNFEPSGAAGPPVQGQGTAKFLAKWVSPTGPPLTASCAVSPTGAQLGESVTWLATPSGGGGAGTYSFLWSGSEPLAGRTDNPAVVSYSTLCEKTGAVTVTSLSQSIGPVACDNTVTISSAIMSASPPSILPTQQSTITWNAPGFDSCGITDNFGNVIKPPGSPINGSVPVAPLVTTTYTLSCIAEESCGPDPLIGTDTTTITVAGVPRFREIPPQ